MKQLITKALGLSFPIFGLVCWLAAVPPARADGPVFGPGAPPPKTLAPATLPISPVYEAEQKARKARLARPKVLSWTQARIVFKLMALQSDISFGFPTDGCYARAHLMVRRLQALGFHPFKVWSFANGERLFCRTRSNPRGYVEWAYHVAPTLLVRSSKGKIRHLVFDPSIFKRPVTIARWARAQKRYQNSRNPFICITRIGQAPRKPIGICPGTGYWPGADPRHGADYHALGVMKLFKPWEGRMAPKKVLALASRI
jgi:hypothetical protein